MLQAYEGYIEQNRFYPIGPPISTKGRYRVIVTVIEETKPEQTDTWAALDSVVAEMDAPPSIEDFPRLNLGREPLNFAEV